MSDSAGFLQSEISPSRKDLDYKVGNEPRSTSSTLLPTPRSWPFQRPGSLAARALVELKRIGPIHGLECSMMILLVVGVMVLYLGQKSRILCYSLRVDFLDVVERIFSSIPEERNMDDVNTRL